MLAAFTLLKTAQKVKEFLFQKKALHTEYLPQKQLDHIYFPMAKKIRVPSAQIVDTKFSFEKKLRSLRIEDLLEGKLTKKEFTLLPRSQEIIGSIMILEILPELEKKEKIIAEAYLTLTKHIQTVVKKKEVHSGVFRTRRVQIIAGKRTKETIHYENGIKLKVHLEKTYFTSRLANERLRIAKLVQKDEEVLVMFSGVAPYPLVIAKNSEAKKVYGIEINPFAHQYALENIALNKLEDKVVIYEGDVRNLLPKLRKKFDRIVMPLPKTGGEFLYLVLPRLKHNGFIHLYAFLEEGKIEAERKQILERGRVLGYSLECRTIVTCGQFSPSTFRVCFDLKMREKRKKKI